MGSEHLSHSASVMAALYPTPRPATSRRGTVTVPLRLVVQVRVLFSSGVDVVGGGEYGGPMREAGAGQHELRERLLRLARRLCDPEARLSEEEGDDLCRQWDELCPHPCGTDVIFWPNELGLCRRDGTVLKTGRVAPGGCPPRAQDSLPAAGQALPDGLDDFHPQGPGERFPCASLHHFLLSHASLGAISFSAPAPAASARRWPG